MKLQEIKQLNITLLFSEPLNHLLITPKDVVDLFKTGDEDLDKHNIIEAPSLKVFVFPKQQKEIIFEANRLLINDKSGLAPEKSKIIEFLDKIMKSKIFSLEKVAAYGFNYDAVVATKDKKIKPSEFASNKIIKVIKNIQKAGVQLVFHKKEVRFDFRIQPISGAKLLAHINVHYTGMLPSIKELKENLATDFKYFVSLIAKL